MITVFVYGTLKRGGSNHACLAGQRFLGEARTVSGYTLYSMGDYPGMVRSPGDKAGVTGELWGVDDNGMKQLDLLEGVNESLYERVMIKLAAPNEGQPVETYLYLGNLSGRKMIGPTWQASCGGWVPPPGELS